MAFEEIVPRRLLTVNGSKCFQAESQVHPISQSELQCPLIWIIAYQRNSRILMIDSNSAVATD